MTYRSPIKRYQFYRRYHGRLISLSLAPDPALFWGFTAGVLVVMLIVTNGG